MEFSTAKNSSFFYIFSPKFPGKSPKIPLFLARFARNFSFKFCSPKTADFTIVFVKKKKKKISKCEKSCRSVRPVRQFFFLFFYFFNFFFFALLPKVLRCRRPRLVRPGRVVSNDYLLFLTKMSCFMKH